MPVTVRTLRATDGPVWQGLFASVAEEGRWIGAEAPVPDLEREYVDRYLDNERAVLLLAEVDGVAVGWLTADIDDAGSAEIGMGIVDGHRGRGIGSQLMTEVIAWASTRAERLRLDVFPHNDAAIALYRKFGFVEVATHEGAWRRRNGERWDLIAMERAANVG